MVLEEVQEYEILTVLVAAEAIAREEIKKVIWDS